MAEDEDLIGVIILGCVVMAYSVLFYLCDEEYRKNFHTNSANFGLEESDPVENIKVRWSKAKDQFNSIAEKFEKMEMLKKVLKKF